MTVSFRLGLVGLLCCLGACDAPEHLEEDGEIVLRAGQSVGTPSGQTGIGIITSNPYKAMSTCMNFCDSVECSEPCEVPNASLESLGGDKWLCSCECECTTVDCPLEFIHACDPSGL